MISNTSSTPSEPRKNPASPLYDLNLSKPPVSNCNFVCVCVYLVCYVPACVCACMHLLVHASLYSVVLQPNLISKYLATSWWQCQGVGAMNLDGNKIQNSCTPRHWGHLTMHQVPPVSGNTNSSCSLLPSGSNAPSPDTTTPLLARYLLIKIWLPGNRLQLLVSIFTPCAHAQQG